jgi:glycosyltransferase involved in cell wall biosynthesis
VEANALFQVLRSWRPGRWTGPWSRQLDLDDPSTIEGYRRAFAAERKRKRYRSAFHGPDPLVTVCIATADRAEVLAERALASMVRQTYKKLQVVIVGDCCEDNTADVVASFRDRRFEFHNLPVRGPYPRPGRPRQRVAGTYPMNEALRRATGLFITHLDEDDTFEDHRIETLLAAIRNTEADVVFHPFWWEDEDRSWSVLGNGRFELGQTGTSMVFYHHWFRRIPWNVRAYEKGEPGDWNRFRKFVATGAQTHYVDERLTRHWRYPKRGPFKEKPGETYLA